MRRAKLTIVPFAVNKKGWLRLTGRNGEIQLAGEIVSQPKRARAAIIRAMVDVLESEGYVVAKAEEAGR